MSEPRKILVTSALPYANGSIHLGHMLEYIQTDMWVRFQKMRGNQAVYVCADDAHGSAIMLRAEREGITSEQLIDAVRAEHMGDFADFLVDFDNYHSTHSEENRELSSAIYLKLRDAGHIDTRPVTQYFRVEIQALGTRPNGHGSAIRAFLGHDPRVIRNSIFPSIRRIRFHRGRAGKDALHEYSNGRIVK